MTVNFGNKQEKPERMISDSIEQILKLKEDVVIIRSMFIESNYVEILKTPLGDYWEFIISFSSKIITNSEGMLRLQNNINVSLWQHPTKIENNVPGVVYAKEE